jgi:hypothetical protein
MKDHPNRHGPGVADAPSTGTPNGTTANRKRTDIERFQLAERWTRERKVTALRSDRKGPTTYRQFSNAKRPNDSQGRDAGGSKVALGRRNVLGNPEGNPHLDDCRSHSLAASSSLDDRLSRPGGLTGQQAGVWMRPTQRPRLLLRDSCSLVRLVGGKST